MKKYILNMICLSLFVAVLGFTSCQEEFEEVGGETDTQETLTANSNTADLMVKTSSNDGSFDNIVDGASCLAINFPYTVEISGVQITIDAIEDLDLIEEIFDEFDGDADILDLIFPVTITLGDFTEIVIESKEQLLELVADCREGGDDADIECIDFVYPITLFTFDVNEQLTDEVAINGDKELRRFFAGLGENDLISIQFPVTLKKYDGTEIEINSNASLEEALEMAEDECDEDDDNDFNDDDFNKEQLDEVLTECPWKIREVLRDSVDLTDNLIDFTLTFDGEGNVVVRDFQGGIFDQGQWQTELTDNGVKVSLTFDADMNSPFTNEWLAYAIGENKIKFFEDGGDKIIVEQDCEGDFDDSDDSTDNEELIEGLKECAWIIEVFENEPQEVNNLLGYELDFKDDDIFTLTNGITTVQGEWAVGKNDLQEPVLFMTFIIDDQEVSILWTLQEQGAQIWKFKVDETGDEMILQKACADDQDNNIAEIQNIMLGGLWNVALFDIEGTDLTNNFEGFDFNFSTFNQVEVSINDDPIGAGVWRITRGLQGDLQFFLNLSDNDLTVPLTEAWFVMEVSADRIRLVYEDADVNFKSLVFERKM